MKVLVIVSVLVAMANAQGSRVNVVEHARNNNGGGVSNPDPGFYQNPGTGVNVVNNPDPYFYQNPGTGVNVVNNPDPYFYQNPGVNVVNNPDPYFYQNPEGNIPGVVAPDFYYNPNQYQGGYAGNQVVIPNPDPFFAGGNGATGSGQFQPGGSQYPPHLYPGPGGRPGNTHPGARGGN